MTDPVVDRYLAWCARQRQPPNTIRARRRVLDAIPHPATATRAEVEAWWDSRAHLSPATRSADLAILRKFYQWADIWEERDSTTVWPINRLEAPKVNQGIPRPIHSTEFAAIIASVDDELRRAMYLGAWAGLRVSEAAALMWPDVDTDQQMISVRESKGGHSRRVAVDWALIDKLLPNTGGNVVTGTDRVLSAAALRNRANRAIVAAGVDATFHQLRHRYGTLAYRESRDLLAVGRAMGHRSPSSTAVYAEPSDDVARQIATAVTR